jgi:oligopeptide/dipeptide ABC transporter, ATP-binding protein, C-terminal domain
VGESGCGKTTAALSICRLLPANGYIADGEILVDGVDYCKLNDKEILPHRWKDVSMIFQGAMNAFNPVKTVGWQIAEAIMLHDGLDKKAAMERAGDLLELVEVPRDRVRHYPHEFSGGMKQRAMISMALACNPKLIIGDEPTTALDVMVQAQILNLLERLRREIHMGMILITHDLSILGETCDKIAVMYAGRIAETGSVDDIFRHAAHPYTQKLISCFPDISKRKEIPDGIPGFPPNLIAPPKGCRFAPRCEFSCDKCREVDPFMRRLSDSHSVACHLEVEK